MRTSLAGPIKDTPQGREADAILQPALSRPLLRAKLRALEAGKPEIIATANIGCYAYLRQEARVPVVHWVERLV